MLSSTLVAIKLRVRPYQACQTRVSGRSHGMIIATHRAPNLVLDRAYARRTVR